MYCLIYVPFPPPSIPAIYYSEHFYSQTISPMYYLTYLFLLQAFQLYIIVNTFILKPFHLCITLFTFSSPKLSIYILQCVLFHSQTISPVYYLTSSIILHVLNQYIKVANLSLFNFDYHYVLSYFYPRWVTLIYSSPCLPSFINPLCYPSF